MLKTRKFQQLRDNLKGLQTICHYYENQKECVLTAKEVNLNVIRNGDHSLTWTKVEFFNIYGTTQTLLQINFIVIGLKMKMSVF
jgi:hypothetical protein